MAIRGSNQAARRQERLQGRRVIPLNRRQRNEADAAEAKAMAADALAHIKRERAADEAQDAAPCDDCNSPKGEPHRRGCIWDTSPDDKGGDNGGPPKPDDSEQGASADTGAAGASGEADP